MSLSDENRPALANIYPSNGEETKTSEHLKDTRKTNVISTQVKKVDTNEEIGAPKLGKKERNT